MKWIPLVLIAAVGCQGQMAISTSDEGAHEGIAPSEDVEDSSDSNATTEPVADGTTMPLDPEAEPDVGPTTMTRISRADYVAYVESVLPGVDVRAELLPPDHRVGQFTSNATQAVTQPDLEAYWQSAEHIAGQLVADDLCDPDVSDADCFAHIGTDLARRLFRRPAQAEVLDELASLGQQVASDGATRTEVVQLLVATVLQSPRFVYHIEPVADVAGMQPLDDHAVAHRLARFLWNGAPDTELLDAADAGALLDPTEVERHARRLLDDPRAETAVRAFHRDWLDRTAP